MGKILSSVLRNGKRNINLKGNHKPNTLEYTSYILDMDNDINIIATCQIFKQRITHLGYPKCDMLTY